MPSRRPRRACLFAAVAYALCIAVPAAAVFPAVAAAPAPAQGTAAPPSDNGAPSGNDPEALRRKLDELFDATLRDPADLSLTLRYAEAATRLGDFEAAITALERILFFNPSLAQARLELGVLYFRLGSHGIARGYLEEAKRDESLPPDLRARIDEYLARIVALEQRHRLTGQVFGGLQHQSNANLGPNSPLVRAAPFGVTTTATLESRFVKQADQSLFAGGSALYAYDLQNQDHDAIEVTASGYASKHFRLRSFDLNVIEATAGPRFGLATRGLPDLTVRPYAIGNYVRLGRDPYFHSYGVGIEGVRSTLGGKLLLKGIYEHREKNFEDAPDRPNSRELTGRDDIVALSAVGIVAAGHVLGATAGFTRQDTRAEYQSNREFTATVTYQITHPAPFGLALPAAATATAWQTGFYGSRSVALYDAPNPAIDPDSARADRRWRFGAIETIPVADDVALIVQIQRDEVSSTLPNFTYSSISVLFGPQVRF